MMISDANANIEYSNIPGLFVFLNFLLLLCVLLLLCRFKVKVQSKIDFKRIKVKVIGKVIN